MFTWTPITLHLRNPFRLSYGVSETRRVYWLRLEGDAGWGEAAIPPYYGVDPAAMEAYWQQKSSEPAALPETPGEIAAFVGAGPAPARAALDLALHDRLARRAGLPLHRLLDLPAPRPLVTSFTIAIDSPDEMARMALQVAAFPVIKMKLGGEGDDEARIAAVRAARPDARLRVDANAGWDFDTARAYLRRLERYNLELVEQPLARDRHEEMGALQKETRLPIVADESVQTLEDVERLARAGVAGINLKLMKVGGLAPALEILRRAQSAGLRVMLGCMIETSIGATAAAHLSGLAEWADLDSPMLVNDDPFDGLGYGPAGELLLPDRPGIGARRKESPAFNPR